MGAARTLTRYLLIDRVVNPLLKTGSGILLLVMSTLSLASLVLLAGLEAPAGSRLTSMLGLTRESAVWIVSDSLACLALLAAGLARGLRIPEEVYEVVFPAPVTVADYVAASMTAGIAAFAVTGLPGAAIMLFMAALMLGRLGALTPIRGAIAILGLIAAVLFIYAVAGLAEALYTKTPRTLRLSVKALLLLAAGFLAYQAYLRAPCMLALPLEPIAASMVYPLAYSVSTWEAAAALAGGWGLALLAAASYWLAASRLSPYDVAPEPAGGVEEGGGVWLRYGSRRRILYSLALSPFVRPRNACAAAGLVALMYIVGLLIARVGGEAAVAGVYAAWILNPLMAGMIVYSLIVADIAYLVKALWVFRVYLGRMDLFAEAFGARYAAYLAVAAACVAALTAGIGYTRLAAELLAASLPVCLGTGALILAAVSYAASRTKVASPREVGGKEILTITYWPLTLAIEALCIAGLGAPALAAAMGLWYVSATAGIAYYAAARILAGKAAERMDLLS